MEKLNEGEDEVLGITGFGRKSLIDIKKKLRSLGYELPEAEAV
jgi:large subunit ribosomal protein L31